MKKGNPLKAEHDLALCVVCLEPSVTETLVPTSLPHYASQFSAIINIRKIQKVQRKTQFCISLKFQLCRFQAKMEHHVVVNASCHNVLCVGFEIGNTNLRKRIRFNQM